MRESKKNKIKLLKRNIKDKMTDSYFGRTDSAKANRTDSAKANRRINRRDTSLTYPILTFIPLAFIDEKGNGDFKSWFMKKHIVFFFDVNVFTNV